MSEIIRFALAARAPIEGLKFETSEEVKAIYNKVNEINSRFEVKISVLKNRLEKNIIHTKWGSCEWVNDFDEFICSKNIDDLTYPVYELLHTFTYSSWDSSEEDSLVYIKNLSIDYAKACLSFAEEVIDTPREGLVLALPVNEYNIKAILKMEQDYNYIDSWWEVQLPIYEKRLEKVEQDCKIVHGWLDEFKSKRVELNTSKTSPISSKKKSNRETTIDYGSESFWDMMKRLWKDI